MRTEKLSGDLLIALHHFEAAGVAGVMPLARNLGLHPRAGIEAPGAPRAVVFVHCHSKATFEHMAAEGVHVNQRSGEVRTAVLPLDAIGALSDQADIYKIVASRYLRPLMDVAVPHVRLPNFRAANPLSMARM